MLSRILGIIIAISGLSGLSAHADTVKKELSDKLTRMEAELQGASGETSWELFDKTKSELSGALSSKKVTDQDRLWVKALLSSYGEIPSRDNFSIDKCSQYQTNLSANMKLREPRNYYEDGVARAEKFLNQLCKTSTASDHTGRSSVERMRDAGGF